MWFNYLWQKGSTSSEIIGPTIIALPRELEALSLIYVTLEPVAIPHQSTQVYWQQRTKISIVLFMDNTAFAKICIMDH